MLQNVAFQHPCEGRVTPNTGSQRSHGLNTDETRIHFSVQSVFHPWLLPSFVSFVYFVVPILRCRSFDKKLQDQIYESVHPGLRHGHQISPVRQTGPTATVHKPPRSGDSYSNPTAALLASYSVPTQVLLPSYPAPTLGNEAKIGKNSRKAGQMLNVREAKKIFAAKTPRYAPRCGRSRKLNQSARG
jgi:hypothetical protein